MLIFEENWRVCIALLVSLCGVMGTAKHIPPTV
jgi:hypothetical protein